MNNYSGISCKCLLPKAFHRHALITQLDSQQPAPGPDRATQLCGLLPLLANHANTHLRTPEGLWPYGELEEELEWIFICKITLTMRGCQQTSKDGSDLLIFIFQGYKSPSHCSAEVATACRRPPCRPLLSVRDEPFPTYPYGLTSMVEPREGQRKSVPWALNLDSQAWVFHGKELLSIYTS